MRDAPATRPSAPAGRASIHRGVPPLSVPAVGGLRLTRTPTAARPRALGLGRSRAGGASSVIDTSFRPRARRVRVGRFPCSGRRGTEPSRPRADEAASSVRGPRGAPTDAGTTAPSKFDPRPFLCGGGRSPGRLREPRLAGAGVIHPGRRPWGHARAGRLGFWSMEERLGEVSARGDPL